MQVAPFALVICSLLLLLGYALGRTLVVALLSSLAFGATAIATVPALGGASVQLYALFAVLLVLSVSLHRGLWRDLGHVLSLHWTPAVFAFLLVYVIAGAHIMPRLFEGQTTVFVPFGGRIVERPLMPVSGNLNQSCYFTAGILTYFACSILLWRQNCFSSVKVGLFAFSALHAALGVIDLLGKLTGAGDILAPIRTAEYSMLVEVRAAGFWRITGGFPEASAFGSISVVVLAFTFSYWRSLGSRLALFLSVVLLSLTLLSTSSTAYGSFAILLCAVAASLLYRAASRTMTERDLAISICMLAVAAVIVAVLAFSTAVLEAVADLVDTTLINKSMSESAQERSYWNQKSWAALIDTGGLGIGLGSSRASGSLFAIPSQMGVVGTVLFLLLVLDLLVPVRGPELDELTGLCRGLRSAGLAILIPSAISGGGADPGLFFFFSSGALMIGRVRLKVRSSSRLPTPACATGRGFTRGFGFARAEGMLEPHRRSERYQAAT